MVIAANFATGIHFKHAQLDPALFLKQAVGIVSGSGAACKQGMTIHAISPPVMWATTSRGLFGALSFETTVRLLNRKNICCFKFLCINRFAHPLWVAVA